MSRKLEVTILEKPVDDGLVSFEALNTGDVFQWPDSEALGLKALFGGIQIRGYENCIYVSRFEPSSSFKTKLLGKLVGITVEPY